MRFSNVRIVVAILVLMLCPGGLWLSARLTVSDQPLVEPLLLLPASDPTRSDPLGAITRSCSGTALSQDPPAGEKVRRFAAGPRPCAASSAANGPVVPGSVRGRQKAAGPTGSSYSGVVCGSRNAVLLFHLSTGDRSHTVSHLRHLAYSFVSSDTALPACDTLFMMSDLRTVGEADLDLPPGQPHGGGGAAGQRLSRSAAVRLLPLAEYAADAPRGGHHAVTLFAARWLARHGARYSHVAVGVINDRSGALLHFARGSDPFAAHYDADGFVCAGGRRPVLLLRSLMPGDASLGTELLWMSGTPATVRHAAAVAAHGLAGREGGNIGDVVAAVLSGRQPAPCAAKNSSETDFLYDTLIVADGGLKQIFQLKSNRSDEQTPLRSPLSSLASDAELLRHVEGLPVLELPARCSSTERQPSGCLRGVLADEELSNPQGLRSLCRSRNAVVLVLCVWMLGDEEALSSVVAGYVAVFNLHFASQGCHDLLLVFAVDEAAADVQTAAVGRALQSLVGVWFDRGDPSRSKRHGILSRVMMRLTRTAVHFQDRLHGRTADQSLPFFLSRTAVAQTAQIASSALEELYEASDVYQCVMLLPHAALPTRVFVLSNVLQTTHCEAPRLGARRQVLIAGCVGGGSHIDASCMSGVGLLMVGPPHELQDSLRRQPRDEAQPRSAGEGQQTAAQPAALVLAFQGRGPIVHRLAAVVVMASDSYSHGGVGLRADPLWRVWLNHTLLDLR